MVTPLHLYTLKIILLTLGMGERYKLKSVEVFVNSAPVWLLGSWSTVYLSKLNLIIFFTVKPPSILNMFILITISILVMMQLILIAPVVSFIPHNFSSNCWASLHFTSVPSTALMVVPLQQHSQGSLRLSKVVVQLVSTKTASLTPSTNTSIIKSDLSVEEAATGAKVSPCSFPWTWEQYLKCAQTPCNYSTGL